MTYERIPGVTSVVERPLAAAPSRGSQVGDDVSVATRLQILSTEHWSLLASRSMTWNEIFSRAGMLLSTVTGAIIALALVADASNFGAGFRQFALVILPVVLFIGVGTLVAMGAAQYHDALCVAGMNRIRATYVELAPDLEPVFVMGTHDDDPGVLKTMAGDLHRSPIVHMISATPMMVGTLDSILLGAIASLLAIEMGASDAAALALGTMAFFIGTGLHVWWARRSSARVRHVLEPLFPSPATPHQNTPAVFSRMRTWKEAKSDVVQNRIPIRRFAAPVLGDGRDRGRRAYHVVGAARSRPAADDDQRHGDDGHDGSLRGRRHESWAMGVVRSMVRPHAKRGGAK